MKISWPSLVLLALVACGPRNPPSEGEALAQAVSPASLVTPPVRALIGYREQLELNSDQINAIDSIATWLNRQNGSLLEEEIGQEAARGEPNPLSRLMRIGENNAAAVAGIQELLSVEQQREVCEIFEPTEEARERRVPRRGRRPRRAEADSLARLATSPWPWCARPPASERR